MKELVSRELGKRRKEGGGGRRREEEEGGGRMMGRERDIKIGWGCC